MPNFKCVPCVVLAVGGVVRKGGVSFSNVKHPVLTQGATVQNFKSVAPSMMAVGGGGFEKGVSHFLIRRILYYS